MIGKFIKYSNRFAYEFSNKKEKIAYEIPNEQRDKIVEKLLKCYAEYCNSGILLDPVGKLLCDICEDIVEYKVRFNNEDTEG